jgi:hypothetical protein
MPPRFTTRRSFLRYTLGASGLLVAGCTGAGAASGPEQAVVQDEPASEPAATGTAPAQPLVTSTPTPTPTPAPEPPSLTLPDVPVPQGGSFAAIITGTGVTLAQVSFAGRTYRAAPDGGGWLAMIGAGQRIGLTEQHTAGVYPVSAQLGMVDGSNHSLSGEVTVTATRFPVEAIYLAPAETALLDPALTQRELAILRPLYDGFTPRRLWEGFFLRPTSGPITDVFGSRRSYNGGPAVGSHSGVDFGADAGTPVMAAATGRVAYAGPLPVRGNTVVIDHGAGVFTGYCHLSSISAQAEQEVRAGDEIARVGSSGLATGPHLHWEVAVGGYHVNGMLWLAG